LSLVVTARKLGSKDRPETAGLGQEMFNNACGCVAEVLSTKEKRITASDSPNINRPKKSLYKMLPQYPLYSVVVHINSHVINLGSNAQHL